MINIEEIKKISNPYLPLTPKVEKKDFIGREDEIIKIRRILDDYDKTFKLKNMLISGEKAVGKSTLLNRYKDILVDYNFYTYSHQFSLKEAADEFSFFKDFFRELFLNFSPPEGDFLDSEQADIWFSLTEGDLNHNSNYIKRKISFATDYASKMKGNNVKLSYKQILADFSVVLGELISSKFEYKGVALVLDEFQELAKNTTLLDTLRILTEELDGLIIIGAGVPSFLGNISFEKFTRTSDPFTISNFSQKESFNLIFNPLVSKANINRYDAENLFDKATIRQLIERSDGNPLHLKLLCSHIFEHFAKSSDAKKMTLNRDVMNSVMQFYCNNSEKSWRIRNSLDTAGREKLQLFSKLYYYEGFSIKAAILSEIAFNSIQDDVVKETKEQLLNNLNEIFDLGLFEIYNCDCHVLELKKKSLDELAQISYKFIGDSIDKLYATYYYESASNGEALYTPVSKDFDLLLTEKLSAEITSAFLKKKVELKVNLDPLINIKTIPAGKETKAEEIISSLEKIAKIDPEKEINDEDKKMVNDITTQIDLSLPAAVLSAFDFSGYYLLITNVTIRGKNKVIYSYFPITANLENINKFISQFDDYKEYISASLDEYNININWMYVYFLPKEPLLIIYSIDISDMIKKLVDVIKDRDFNKAATLSDYIFKINLKYSEKSVYTAPELYNNYGFCLLNIGDYDTAENIFNELKERYLISKINLSFLNFIKGNIGQAKRILKSILKKSISSDYEVTYLHLCLKHEGLDTSDLIIESVPAVYVVAWNLALISAEEREDVSIINSHLKKIKIKEQYLDSYYRTKSWISYYQNNIDDAIALAEKNLLKLKSESYLNKVIKKDINIFKSYPAL